MLVSQKIIDKALQQNPDGSKGLILDLSLKQIIGLKGVEKFLEPNEIEKLLLSTNYVPVLDQNFHLFNNLKELDLSINHISKIENLDSLQNLRLLNLSNNRISKIENLEALKNLEVLDLSMNYLEKIENLKLKNLKTLILSGNNITELENLHHVRQLQNLEIEKNGIEDINTLTIFGLKDLRKIVFAYNKIPIDRFNDLLMLLQAMPTLEELNFLGNEITLHKLYKPRIMQFSNIQVLDKLALKDPIKKHFEALRQDVDVQELIEQTKKDYLDRMEKENQLKSAALDMIEKQKRQVDDIFDEHMKVLQDDLQAFFERAQELKLKRIKGELTEEATQEVLNGWQNGVKRSHIEKKQAYEEALKRQQHLQREYLEAELTSKKFTEKLYEISMKRPEIWKEIKLREQEQFMAEEDKVNKAKKMNPNADESELRHYQALANQLQVNMLKDVAHAVIDYEAKELHDQREKAATVLKHALLKQMVNHYTALKPNNHPVEDDEEDEELTQRGKDMMKFDTTDDELKKMLYSKVYKDGKWKDDIRPKEAPQDLSNQSLQELLKIEADKNKDQRKSKKKPSNKNKQPNHMIMEEDEDLHNHSDDRRGSSPQRGPSPQQYRPTLDDDDLMRDPFEGDGATYYDEKHVVGEKSGQKIILIPFEENTNMLDGISAIKGNANNKKPLKRPPTPPVIQKQPQPKPVEKPVEKPKPVEKKKPKNELENVLADLDDYNDNGLPVARKKEKVPSLNIPEYHLKNKPYEILDKPSPMPSAQPQGYGMPQDGMPQQGYGEPQEFPQSERPEMEGEAAKKPKKKKNKGGAQPEQNPEPEQVPQPPQQSGMPNKDDKGKKKENKQDDPAPPKKSSMCNMF